MAHEVPEPDRADPTRAEVLVAIGPRSARRARIVEMDQGEPVEPDPPVELGEQVIDGDGVADIDAGTPGVGRVEAEPDEIAADAASGQGVGDVHQLIEGRAEAPAAARRVLEDEECRGRGPGSHGVAPDGAIGFDRGKDRLGRFGKSPGPGRRPVAPVGADVDVHEARSERRRAAQLRGEERDRPFPKMPAPTPRG